MVAAQRFFIEIAYDGTHYHGWQQQPNALGIQEVLNKALSTIFREPIETVGCGRTDTGVHASQFFAHFDTGVNFNANGSWIIEKERFVRSVNAILPHDIAVKNIFPVANDAHARFDAVLRSYEYHIHFNKNPFKTNYSWLLRDVPDMERMNQAANIILEYTDFSCFSKSNTQVKTNNCKISRAEWVKIEDGIVFHISADRFLRNMVRAIAGTLLQVGKQEIEPYEIGSIIQSKNRAYAGVSVPACGLYLTQVVYPPTP